MTVFEETVARDALAALESIEHVTSNYIRDTLTARRVLSTNESVVVEYTDDQLNNSAFRITVNVKRL